jgi:hypothetical protein
LKSNTIKSSWSSSCSCSSSSSSSSSTSNIELDSTDLKEIVCGCDQSNTATSNIAFDWIPLISSSSRWHLSASLTINKNFSSCESLTTAVFSVSESDHGESVFSSKLYLPPLAYTSSGDWSTTSNTFESIICIWIGSRHSDSLFSHETSWHCFLSWWSSLHCSWSSALSIDSYTRNGQVSILNSH